MERVETSGQGVDVSRSENVGEYRVKQNVTRVGMIDHVITFTVRTKAGVERLSVSVRSVGVEPVP